LLKEKKWNLAKKSIEDRLPKNFQPNARRNFLKEKNWKFAKKSIEDRSTKISQSMCVENCSKTNLEVGEEVHRRPLHENFPPDTRRNCSEKKMEVGEEVNRRSFHEKFSHLYPVVYQT
jgi:hypothetical protein